MGSSNQVGNRVWIKEWNNCGGFSQACLPDCPLDGSWSGVRVGMHGAYCWLGQLLLEGDEPHSLSSPWAGLKPIQG